MLVSAKKKPPKESLNNNTSNLWKPENADKIDLRFKKAWEKRQEPKTATKPS